MYQSMTCQINQSRNDLLNQSIKKWLVKSINQSRNGFLIPSINQWVVKSSNHDLLTQLLRLSERAMQFFLTPPPHYLSSILSWWFLAFTPVRVRMTIIAHHNFELHTVPVNPAGLDLGGSGLGTLAQHHNLNIFFFAFFSFFFLGLLWKPQKSGIFSYGRAIRALTITTPPPSRLMAAVFLGPLPLDPPLMAGQ